MNRRLLRVVGLGLVLTGPVMVAPAHGQARVVLTGGTLIDGTGAAPLPGARIVIEGGRFTCISDAAGCPGLPGDRLVDLTGRWVSPGLIDTHVHLPYGRDTTRLARFQRLRFALGITTVRDAGSPYIEPLLRERATWPRWVPMPSSSRSRSTTRSGGRRSRPPVNPASRCGGTPPEARPRRSSREKRLRRGSAASPT